MKGLPYRDLSEDERAFSHTRVPGAYRESTRDGFQFSFDNEAPIFLQSSFSSSMLLHDFAISRSSGLISSSFNLAPSVARFESFHICGAKGRITYDAAAAFRGSRIFLADLLESHATMFRSCSYTKCHLRQHRAARQ